MTGKMTDDLSELSWRPFPSNANRHQTARGCSQLPPINSTSIYNSGTGTPLPPTTYIKKSE